MSPRFVPRVEARRLEGASEYFVAAALADAYERGRRLGAANERRRMSAKMRLIIAQSSPRDAETIGRALRELRR